MAEKVLSKYNFGENCVCIGRVSTSQQSQTAQVTELKAYAEQLGYKNIQTFFTTESGFLEFDDKQGWNLVVDFFESHSDYKVLICSEISRLSRREAILQTIKEYLKDNKIQLIIKDINFFLFNEWGEIPKGNDIVFALYASLADSEMRQKRERFHRVLSDNKRLGYSIGGKELFGYDRDYEMKDGKRRSIYRINQDEAKIIKEIYKWYAFGIDGDITNTSILTITRECIERGFPRYLHSKRNVNKCLKEKAYCGLKTTENRIKNPEYWNYKNYNAPKYIKGNAYDCKYPAIFEGEEVALFNKVQERLVQNNSKINFEGNVPVDKSQKHTTILSKLIVCPECGTYLHGEYRMRRHTNRPEEQPRYTFSYRCTYARGAIKTCNFKHLLSMPLLDSVVWGYCRTLALKTISRESKAQITANVAEIDDKIKNLKAKISEYDIDRQKRAEEAILRSKIKMAKTDDAAEKAIKEFYEKTNAIDKEVNGFEQRILELEQEKENINEGVSIVALIKKQKSIPSDKKQLYLYLHKIVSSVDIVFANLYYTIIRINLKESYPFKNKDEYVCIYRKSSQKISALILYPQDREIEQMAKRVLEKEKDKFLKSFILKNLPSSKRLLWDKEANMFRIDEYCFTIDALFAYMNTNYERQVLDEFSDIPVGYRKLECERLTCYSEDERIPD